MTEPQPDRGAPTLEAPLARRAPITIGPRLLPLLGLGLVAVLLLGGSGAVGSLGADGLAALVVGSVLLLVTIPIASRLSRVDQDPRLMAVILAGFVAKMFGAIVRHTVLYEVYSGSGDARRYYGVGIELADQFRNGDFPFGAITGTRFLEIASGFAYTVLPRSELAGFLFFSWLAFLGLLLFTRAIRWALPEADHRRYDLLVLFLPTMLFWPSSIGKEAWMVLMVGLAAYGAARVLTNSLIGLVPLALGLWGATVVRPHMAIIIVAAVAPAWLLKPSGRNRLGLGPYGRAAGFAALILALLIVVSQAEAFFGVESLDAEGTDAVATRVEGQTGQGGSEFGGARVQSPLDLPKAAVTILFRPFPFEATSAQELLTAFEGMALFGLLILARKQIRALPSTILRHPYVLFALVYTLAFIVAFSTIANFGILVRQRAQLFPLFLVLLVPVKAQVQQAVARRDGPWRTTPYWTGRGAQKPVLQ